MKVTLYFNQEKYSKDRLTILRLFLILNKSYLESITPN